MRSTFLFLVLFLRVSFGQIPSPGYLLLQTPRSGLVAIIQDTLRFPLNQPIQLVPGAYRLRVPHPEGRIWQNLDFTAEVQILPDDTLRLEVRFTQIYDLITKPFNATVIQREDTLGFSPLQMGVTQFPAELSIEKSGYQAGKIRIDPETPTPLRIDLDEKKSDFSPLTFEKGKEKKISPWLKYSLVGISILSGAIAASYKQEADRQYEKYTTTLDPVYYDRTRSLDRKSSVSFAVTQISILSFMILLIQE